MVMSQPAPKQATTSSRACDSEGLSSFDRLHPTIQRWIWDQKWDELRDIQERSIPAILDGKGDVLISASTAAGKTEAAFLPILTAVAGRSAGGLSVICVSPLKALINDQFGRLDLLCERMEVPVVRWHGDAPQAAKIKTLENPRGIALITPESIEALFIRRSGDVRRLLGALDYIVVDELHAFLTGPRGLHLASLLRRIDLISEKRPRRVGLSATLGDLAVAAEWLNPDAAHTVSVLESLGGLPERRLQIRAYFDSIGSDQDDAERDNDDKPGARDRIAAHIFANLRGSNNLVFAGSRGAVEWFADDLRRRCENLDVPNEFFPHHGNLSKEIRADLESRLKRGDLPITGIATTTLELGIDIGSVKSVAQIGAPRSLTSLRQRLGRSGRRNGTPAILRIYLEVLNADDPLDRLRLEVVQSVAAVRLLLAGFAEPPGLDPSIATVVLHQVLSIVTEQGGMRADHLHHAICSAGPLAEFGKNEFIELLKAMASEECKLIEQAPSGAIMLGESGERLTARRDFFAIFETDDEWRLVSEGRPLGTISISNSLGVGSDLLFAGRRWRVEAVDDRGKVLQVVAHRAGDIPRFDNKRGREPIHDRLATEMLDVYRDTDVPRYLDDAAKALLKEGRKVFRELRLDSSHFIQIGGDTHVMLWRGTAINDLFSITMKSIGLKCIAHDVGIKVISSSLGEVEAAILKIANGPSKSIDELALFVKTLRTARYDADVPEALLRRLWARRNASIAAELPAVARSILESHANYAVSSKSFGSNSR
jgi:ATP-dependent Lhr-like helicase